MVRGGSRTLGISQDSLIANCEAEEASLEDVDVRLVIRGHDFMQICCYYLKTRYPSLFRDGRAPYKTFRAFEMALMTCLELADLTEESLFQNLLLRHVTSNQAA